MHKEYIIKNTATVLDALEKISKLASFTNSLVLFVVNNKDQVIGSLTDGDIRRALIKGMTTNGSVEKIMRKQFYFIDDIKDYKKIKEFKKQNLRVIPYITKNKKIIEFIDLQKLKSILPVDAVIMAGGKGVRLSPYTIDKPKPMLELDGKPIIANNIDRLILFGIKNFYISVSHLKEQIKNYVNKNYKDINIEFVEEIKPLGTIGSLSLIKKIINDDILVMNADILTNIDFEDFFINYKDHKDDMSVATFNTRVDIPYAVLETDGKHITSFVEKPSYTYYSNAGIYIFNKKYVKLIPYNEYFDAIDLINTLIKNKKQVSHFPIRGYWLDIGNVQNYLKAQDDIKYVRF